MKFFYLLSLMIFFVSIEGCGGGNAPSITVPEKKIKLLSPVDRQTVSYSNITLEVEIDQLSDIKAKNLSIPNSNAIAGINNSDSAFFFHMPLSKGENRIEISALDIDGNAVSISVTLTSQGFGFPPINFDISPDEGYRSVTSNINIKPFNNAKEYLIDKEGDGVFDGTSTTGQFTLTFNALGNYIPLVTVRTTDNILYTGTKHLISPVSVKPTPKVSELTGIRDSILDLEVSGEYIYALASEKIYKISAQNTSNVEEIRIFNLSNPQGFSIDIDGNLFIADTGNHRVIKLLRANNYSRDYSISSDGSFGQPGMGDGEFNFPRDVTVFNRGNAQEIFVLDSGNNRVQIFNSSGIYTGQFDGSSTSGGKLDNPLNMVGAPNVIITDSGNKIVRGLSQAVSGSEQENFIVSIKSSFGKVTYASTGLLVPDLTNQEMIFFHKDGSILKKLKTDYVSLIGLAYEKNNRLLVANKNISGIEKIVIALDPPRSDPTSKVTQFIQAFIENNVEQMSELTGGKQKYIDLLSENRSKALEIFNNIVNYEQSINNVFAGVIVNFKIEGLESHIKFDLDRVNNRWVISSII